MGSERRGEGSILQGGGGAEKVGEAKGVDGCLRGAARIAFDGSVWDINGSHWEEACATHGCRRVPRAFRLDHCRLYEGPLPLKGYIHSLDGLSKLTAAGAFPNVFSLYTVLLGYLLDIFGGGPAMASAAVMTMVADVIPPQKR